MARWNIIDGPNKFDLMVALFVGGKYYGRKDLDFRLQKSSDEETIKSERLVITGLAQNEDKDLEWIFSGYWTGPERGGNERRNWQRANGEYSAETRKGWVEITH